MCLGRLREVFCLADRVRIEHKFEAPYKVRAASGQPLHAFFASLRAMLSGDGDTRLSRYLAEPSIDKKTNTIDWFTPANDVQTVKPFAVLSEAEQEDLLKKIQRNHQIIAGLIEKYKEDGGADFKKAAVLLEEIVSYPDEKHIYSVDGEPRYVYWSHEQENIFDVDREIVRFENKRIGKKGDIGDFSKSRTFFGRGRAIGGGDGVSQNFYHLYSGSFLHFVGAVSFFAIALASLLMAITMFAMAWMW